MTNKKEFFTVSSICREDLIGQGWDAKDLDDSTIQNIADKMGESWCDTGYWETLDIMAKYYKIKKL